ncbi:MAG: hypothetical protein HOD37_17100 [Bacteroidetes bacterium]|mgnify:FL=1|nr:hypothetical protein [Bacteroidota bacterium]
MRLRTLLISVFCILAYSACENGTFSGGNELLSLRCQTDWSGKDKELWILVTDKDGRIIAEREESGGDIIKIVKPVWFSNYERYNLTIIRYAQSLTRIVTYADLPVGLNWFINDWDSTSPDLSISLREKASCTNLRFATNKAEHNSSQYDKLISIKYQGPLPTCLLVTTNYKTGNSYKWHSNLGLVKPFEFICDDLEPMTPHLVDLNESLTDIELVGSGHIHKGLYGHGFQFVSQEARQTENGLLQIETPEGIFQDYSIYITQWKNGRGRSFFNFGSIPTVVELPNTQITYVPQQLNDYELTTSEPSDMVQSSWRYATSNSTKIDWQVYGRGATKSSSFKLTDMPKVISENYSGINFSDIDLYRIRTRTTKIGQAQRGYLDYFMKELVNNVYYSGLRQYGVIENYNY